MRHRGQSLKEEQVKSLSLKVTDLHRRECLGRYRWLCGAPFGSEPATVLRGRPSLEPSIRAAAAFVGDVASPARRAI